MTVREFKTKAEALKGTRIELLRRAELARRASQENTTDRGRHLARERYLDAISALRFLDYKETS